MSSHGLGRTLIDEAVRSFQFNLIDVFGPPFPRCDGCGRARRVSRPRELDTLAALAHPTPLSRHGLPSQTKRWNGNKPASRPVSSLIVSEVDRFV